MKISGAKMSKIDLDKLLQRKEVIEEINRHLWLESEKAGENIGFDEAAKDWFNRFSAAWMKYHLSKRKASLKRSPSTPVKKKAAARTRKTARACVVTQGRVRWFMTPSSHLLACPRNRYVVPISAVKPRPMTAQIGREALLADPPTDPRPAPAAPAPRAPDPSRVRHPAG